MITGVLLLQAKELPFASPVSFLTACLRLVEMAVSSQDSKKLARVLDFITDWHTMFPCGFHC